MIEIDGSAYGFVSANNSSSSSGGSSSSKSPVIFIDEVKDYLNDWVEMQVRCHDVHMQEVLLLLMCFVSL